MKKKQIGSKNNQLELQLLAVEAKKLKTKLSENGWNPQKNPSVFTPWFRNSFWGSAEPKKSLWLTRMLKHRLLGFFGRRKPSQANVSFTPPKINMEPENTPLEVRNIIFQTIIFRFYVNLRGCKVSIPFQKSWRHFPLDRWLEDVFVFLPIYTVVFRGPP